MTTSFPMRLRVWWVDPHIPYAAGGVGKEMLKAVTIPWVRDTGWFQMVWSPSKETRVRHFLGASDAELPRAPGFVLF